MIVTAIFVLFLIGGILAVGCELRRRLKEKLSPLARSRSHASFDDFAACFADSQPPVPQVVLEAVYEFFQSGAGLPIRPFPIRAADRLFEDFEIDEEDLGDAVCRIAKKCQLRIPAGAKVRQFPFETVGDMVRLIASFERLDHDQSPSGNRALLTQPHEWQDT